MRLKKNRRISYRDNNALLADLESLKSKLQARYKSGLISEDQLVKVMRKLSKHEFYFIDIDNDGNGSEGLQNSISDLVEKQYAYEQGLAVSRGIARSNLQRELKSLQTIGVM